MLLFVYVFGGALNTGGKYVDYVVPGLIVLCAGFGAGTTAVAVATDMTNGIVDRFRSMPINGSSLLVGHVVASLARNLIATALVIGVGLGIGWRPTGSPAHWVAAGGDDRAVRPGPVLAGGRGWPARPQRRGGELVHLRADVHPLRQHRVRPRPHHARRCCGLRRSTSRSPRSSRRCADSGWATPPRVPPSATRPGSRSPTARPSSPCHAPAPPGCSGTARPPERLATAFRSRRAAGTAARISAPVRANAAG